MIGLNFSPRVSNFIDAADVSGNIKNSRLNLQYLRQIDIACSKASVATGVLYPNVGNNSVSHSINFLNPASNQLVYTGGITHSLNGIKGDGSTGIVNTGLIPTSISASSHMIGGMFFETTSQDGTFMGSRFNDDSSQFQLIINGFGAGMINDFGFRTQYVTTGNRLAIYLTTAANQHYGINLGAIQTNTTNNYPTIDARLTYPITLFARSTNLSGTTGQQFSNKTIQIAFITNGTTTDKAKVFSHDIFIAQRSIGR